MYTFLKYGTIIYDFLLGGWGYPLKIMTKLKGKILDNKEKPLEDVYFERRIGVNLYEYTEKEISLAKRLYKRIVFHVYDSSVTDDMKKDILEKYDWENLNKAIINTVKAVKKNGCIGRNIVCADITRIPFDNLFYDLEIQARDESGNEIIKSLESILTFNSGECSNFKLGFQKGYLNQFGETEMVEHILPQAERDKCYITLNFIRNKDNEGNILKETVAIYYYLGNKEMR